MDEQDHILQNFQAKYADKDEVDAEFVKEMFAAWNETRDMLNRRAIQRERAIYSRNMELKGLEEAQKLRDEKIAAQKAAIERSDWEIKDLTEQLKQAKSGNHQSLPNRGIRESRSPSPDIYLTPSHNDPSNPIPEFDKLKLAATKLRDISQRSVAQTQINRGCHMIRKEKWIEAAAMLDGIVTKLPEKAGANADLVAKCHFWTARMLFGMRDWKKGIKHLALAENLFKRLANHEREKEVIAEWRKKARMEIIKKKDKGFLS